MATREENLKKINDQLEQLSDEQLEQVTGGLSKEEQEKALKALQNPDFAKKLSDLMDLFIDK